MLTLHDLHLNTTETYPTLMDFASEMVQTGQTNDILYAYNETGHSTSTVISTGDPAEYDEGIAFVITRTKQPVRYMVTDDQGNILKLDSIICAFSAAGWVHAPRSSAKSFTTPTVFEHRSMRQARACGDLDEKEYVELVSGSATANRLFRKEASFTVAAGKQRNDWKAGEKRCRQWANSPKHHSGRREQFIRYTKKMARDKALCVPDWDARLSAQLL